MHGCSFLASGVALMSLVAMATPGASGDEGPFPNTWPVKPMISGFGMTMAYVDPERFWLDEPAYDPGRYEDGCPYEVVATGPFFIGTTEVTQHQWETVMGTNPSQTDGRGDLPVENVSWLDCITFCNKLSLREGLAPVYEIDGENVVWESGRDGYRLPNNAEWDYARGTGSSTPDINAPGSEDLGILPGVPHPVGQNPANLWGLHEMDGNVMEWCWGGGIADWFGPEPCLLAVDDDSEAVLQAGHWGATGHGNNVFTIDYNSGTTPVTNAGLRVVRVPPSPVVADARRRGRELMNALRENSGGTGFATLTSYREEQVVLVEREGVQSEKRLTLTVILPDSMVCTAGESSMVVVANGDYANGGGWTGRESYTEFGDEALLAGLRAIRMTMVAVLRDLENCICQALSPRLVDGVFCQPVYVALPGTIDFVVFFLDAATGEVRQTLQEGEVGVNRWVRIRVHEIGEYGGFRLPRLMTLYRGDREISDIRVDSFVANPEIDRRVFERPVD